MMNGNAGIKKASKKFVVLAVFATGLFQLGISWGADSAKGEIELSKIGAARMLLDAKGAVKGTRIPLRNTKDKAFKVRFKCKIISATWYGLVGFGVANSKNKDVMRVYFRHGDDEKNFKGIRVCLNYKSSSGKYPIKVESDIPIKTGVLYWVTLSYAEKGIVCEVALENGGNVWSTGVIPVGARKISVDCMTFNVYPLKENSDISYLPEKHVLRLSGYDSRVTNKMIVEVYAIELEEGTGD